MTAVQNRLVDLQILIYMPFNTILSKVIGVGDFQFAGIFFFWSLLMQEFLSPVTPSAGIFFGGQTLFSRLAFSLCLTAYIHITCNKNVLSSVESRLLGAHGAWRKVLLSKVVLLLCYFFVLNIKRVLCNNVNTQNVKIVARRDGPHIRLSFTPL